jgi:hypothetical protein
LYDNHHHHTVIDRTTALQIAFIGTAAALVTLFASMATNQQAQMQQQQQQQQSSGLPPIMQPGIAPHKPPLTVPQPPPPKLPSQAELYETPQSALQHQAASEEYAKNMLDIINAKMNATHDFSQKRFFSLLQQLHGQGMINCPHPGQPPFLLCELAPKRHR